MRLSLIRRGTKIQLLAGEGSVTVKNMVEGARVGITAAKSVRALIVNGRVLCPHFVAIPIWSVVMINVLDTAVTC